MKTGLISFARSAETEYAVGEFLLGGIEIDTVVSLSEEDDIGFKRAFDGLRDTKDALIVLCGKEEFDVKEKIAEFFDLTLMENENARKILENLSATDLYGATLPEEATLIPNETGEFQGFAIDQAEFTFIALPKIREQLERCCKKYAVGYLSAKAGIKRTALFKCFGETDDIKARIDGANENGVFTARYKEEYCEITVRLIFNDCSDAEYRNAIRNVAVALKGCCFADTDISLSEAFWTRLKLSGKVVSTAESFTSGRVAASITSHPGSSERFYEGVAAYSNESKKDRLGVPERELESEGAVSSRVAYYMALGLLRGGKCDLALATTGLAGPDGDGTGKPVGLCFIAVGSSGGIHTYRFNFNGSREEITQKGVNAALFLAFQTLSEI